MGPVGRKHVEVTIVGARGLKKVAWIGVNQPVAVAWVSPTAARSTHVAVNGGSNPTWNQRLLVPVNEDLQRSVNWVLKVQVSHHVGFLCCLHRSIGTATIPVADILNASNSSYVDGSHSSSSGDHGTSSSPHIHDRPQPLPLPLLTYPLLGAFSRHHGLLDLTVRLLKVRPHSHPPFLPPSPSPHYFLPATSLHEDEETPSASSTHSTSSSSPSSNHSYHEANLQLSPPASPPPLSDSSPTLNKYPSALPPSKSSPAPSSQSTLEDLSKASPTSKLPPAPPRPPPPPPIKRASPPITASGSFPSIPPPPPPPPPTKKASLPRPIPPHNNSATMALPAPKTPTTAPIETTSPTPINTPLPKPPTNKDPLHLISILPSLPTPTTPFSSLTAPPDVELNPKQPPLSLLPYPTPPPTRNPPPSSTHSTRTRPIPSTPPNLTLLHISTTTILPIPPSPMPPSFAHNDKHRSAELINEGSTSSSTKDSKSDGMHEETYHDDGNVSLVGVAALPFTHAKNRSEGDKSEFEKESLSKDNNDPFLPSLSPYDDPFFDLEHLYPHPEEYVEPFYIDPTHLYPCEEDMEASYHHAFESSRNEKI